MHEHILVDVTPPGQFPPGTSDGVITLDNVWEIRYRWCEFPGNSRLDREDEAVEELARLRESGMGTVVELSSAGMGRDPEGLLRVSRASDVHIVMGCGWYIEPFLEPGTGAKSVDELAGEMIRDIRAGAGGTGIRAGVIGEIGCSGAWTDLERRVVAAAALAQRETGASVNVHPHRDPRGPRAIVALIRETGGDPARTVISHIDRTIFEPDDLFELADSGCVLEYDFFGIESSHYPFQEVDLPNDGMRLKAMRALIGRGHLDQLVISQDICTKTRLTRYGGHGYAHIIRNVVPMMRRRGFSEGEIEAILAGNPRRLLTLA
jgi:phosphotriesterase-related protein